MRRAAAVIRGAVLAILLGGCLDANVTECGNGVSCPVGLACDLEHASCVQPEQLAACAGLEAGMPCVTEQISGVCAGAVCLPLGCGNYVVEAGEACDDGNVLAGDGCRPDCRSDETCGNGVIDPGEACDDANLRSRDGCDSRCGIEEPTWRVLPLAPRTGTTTFAYDDSRDRLVVMALTETWEHDGSRWTRVPGPTDQQVNCLHSTPTGVQGWRQTFADRSMVRWTGTDWELVPTVGMPSNPCQSAAFQPTTARAFFEVPSADVSDIWTLDATGVFTRLGPSPAREFENCTLDVVGDEVYFGCKLYSMPGALRAFRWTGAIWSPLPAVPADQHALVGFGGELLAIGRGGTYALAGGGWVLRGDGVGSVDTNGVFDAYVDTSTETLELFVDDRRFTWTGAAWQPRLEPGAGTVPVTADDRSWFLAGSESPHPALLTWTADPSGRLVLATAPELPNMPLQTSVYASGRQQAFVLSGAGDGSSGPIFTYDGRVWAPFASNETMSSLLYRRGPGLLVGFDLDGYQQLADDAEAFEPRPVPQTPRPIFLSAWDARNDRAVALGGGGFTTATVELVDDMWRGLEISPGRAVRVMADERRGTLLVLLVSSAVTKLWERVGGEWFEREALPAAFATETFIYVAATGELVLAGGISGNKTVLVRRFVSPVPDESCGDGADLDGDGLAACADPDCYWACATCPPFTTCQ